MESDQLASGLSMQVPCPSLFGDELFRRRNRIGAEIVVPGAGNAHEALRRLDQTV